MYKQVPIIIGGIEASLRRLAHYDYWSDSVKHSILVDSQADIAVYGMGERAIVAVAEALDSGIAVEDITFIDGCVYRAKNLDAVYDAQMLPSYDDICSDKKQYAKSFLYTISKYRFCHGKKIGRTVQRPFIYCAKSTGCSTYGIRDG